MNVEVSTAALPDRIVVTDGARPREMKPDEFLAIALDKQVELLFKGKVQFFKGTTQLRALDALKVLRQQKAMKAS